MGDVGVGEVKGYVVSPRRWLRAAAVIGATAMLMASSCTWQLSLFIPDGVPPPAGAPVPAVDTHASGRPADQLREWALQRSAILEIPVIALRLDHEPLSKSLEYFLSAQHWIDARDRVHEAHRPAVIGALAAAFRVDGRPRDGRGSRPPMVKEPGAPTRPPAAVVAWRQEQLSAMATRLATYVGPVAAVLVERASRRARDEGELIEMLAKEVDDRSARDRFIAEVRGRIERPASP